MGSVSAKSLEAGSDYKHDPLEGFSQGRKPREIKATLEQMESAKIPLDKRDYCVDSLLKYLDCRADTFPFVYKCHHEKHEYLHCQYEDYLIRMKETERERRLDEKAAKQASHAD